MANVENHTKNGKGKAGNVPVESEIKRAAERIGYQPEPLDLEHVQARCEGIEECLLAVRREIDDLAWIITDLSREEPSCGVEGHQRNALKATAEALMMLHEAEDHAARIGQLTRGASERALPEAAE